MENIDPPLNLSWAVSQHGGRASEELLSEEARADAVLAARGVALRLAAVPSSRPACIAPGLARLAAGRARSCCVTARPRERENAGANGRGNRGLARAV